MKGKAVIWVLLCVFLIVSVNGSVIAIEDETGVKDKDEQTVEKENVPIVENIPFEIKAKSALLMCANTGEIILR